MNIVILTGKFGMGHWSASCSLREQLTREGHRVDIVDLWEHIAPDASEAIYRAFSLLVTYGGGIYNVYHKATRNQPPAEFDPIADKLAQKLGRLVEEEGYQVVVATHPVCAQLFARYKLRQNCLVPLAVCVTDVTCHSEWIAPGADCYLVGAESVRRGLADKGVDPERVFVTGVPIRSAFKRPVRRGGGMPRNLLIMGGGLGLMPKRDTFYDALDQLEEVHTTIITGRNEKLRRRLEGRWANIEVVGFTDRVYDYMARSDLMLSKPGGITMFEAIWSQLPLLAWEPFLEQERENARFLEENAIGAVARKEPEACLAAIRGLIYDDARLSDMSRRMGQMKQELEQQSLEHIVAALARREVSV